MNELPACDKVLLVQAELDGELDAAAAATLALHRAGCAVCKAAAAEITHARELMRDAAYQPMPEDARARLLDRLGLPGPRQIVRQQTVRPTSAWRRPWWSVGAGFGLGAACAAALAVLMLIPAEPGLPEQSGLPEQIVSGHIRALQPGHLQDVASEDRHTVKPWFDGRVDFAPPVKDLAAQRFPLTGGRLDYLAGRPVAALVYQRDKHIIDLFVWPAVDGGTVEAPAAAQRQGYNLMHWTKNGMNFWAVSDVEPGQLKEFAERWQAAP